MAIVGLSGVLNLALLVLVFLVLVCYVRRWKFASRYKLPPGPRCWPIIGFLPFPSLRKHMILRKLGRKYGGIFGMYVGTQYVVVLDDFRPVRDAFNRDTFSNRPPESTQISEKQPSLIDMSGPAWKEQRKFQINSFRLLGTFNKEFEQFIVANATDCVKELKKKIGLDVNTHHAVEYALNNVTFRLLYGKSFEPDHPLIRLLTDYDNAVVHLWGIQTITVFVPGILLPLFELTPKMRHARKIIAQMDEIVLTEIEEHRKTMVEDDPRDYIDHYLTEMGRPGCDPSYTMQNLIGNVKVLLEASSETTNVSLSWFMLCMAEFQDVQAKVFEEIQSVIGVEMEPQYSDRHKLPFTLATIQETMRWKNLIHLNVYRQCSENQRLVGYDIPKGTIIIHNLSSHFYNPKYWPNPTLFDPYRFLSKDGKTVETPEYFIPFSYGTRMCPGDKLAKIALFIFCVTVLQRFQIYPPRSGVIFDDNPIFNSHPVHPYVRFELRQ